METNLEHYYDRIKSLTLCEITENVMAEDIGNKDYCDEWKDCRECLLDTIKWLNEEYKPKLKACPFCGSTKSQTLIVEKDGIDFNDYAICCSVLKGGCGATSGYAQSKDKAIENWNGRKQLC